MQRIGQCNCPSAANGVDHYNYFRDYNPKTGRYIENDPIGLKGGTNTYSYTRSNPAGAFDSSGLDTVVVVGGPISSNPFGHVAIGFTGQGVYSFGTATPLGSSLTQYLSKQGSYRDSTAIIIKTTPAQEAKMIATLRDFAAIPLPNPATDPASAAGDTCATRTNAALSVGGIYSLLQSPNSPYPYSSAIIAGANASQEINIPRGTSIPNVLNAFNPR